MPTIVRWDINVMKKLDASMETPNTHAIVAGDLRVMDITVLVCGHVQLVFSHFLMSSSFMFFSLSRYK